jgi:hypothetical protein
MPTPPRTYDEIIRTTVPDPDGSIRPSAAQRAEAPVEHRDERRRAQATPDEQRIRTQLDALIDPSLGDFIYEVDAATVTLEGVVHTAAASVHLENLARSIAGVSAVQNRLVVST